jgi:Zn-dependent peptidase ImmA (M78 family)/transcriptional regulator with XRE-family HTH domain
MLMVARESRRMSQVTLAKESGVSQSLLSQIEAGTRPMTADVAQKVSGPLRYPASLFTVSLRFQQLPVSFFRKKASIGVRDVNAIRARVNLHRLRVEILLRAREVRDARVALTDIQKEGLTAQEAAERLRMYWNVPPGPIKDLTMLIESAGIIVIPMDFGTAAIDGLSIFETNDSLPPMIFLRATLPPDRWRMTLAHELGHIVLHHHLSIPPVIDTIENEGFAFAQEFLMPTREILSHLYSLDARRLAQLKLHWRVSMKAIVKRATVLGRLSERHARRLYIMLGKHGTNEPVAIEPEVARTVRGLVEYHLTELGFSIRDLSKALHQDLADFQSDFGVAANHLRLA